MRVESPDPGPASPSVAPPGNGGSACADNNGPSVLGLIRDLQAGKANPKLLSIADRRTCIEYLDAEGYSRVEIGEVLKCSERTVFRDIQAIREARTVQKDPKLVAEVVGRLVHEADVAVSHMRRVAREKTTPPAVRVDAHHRCWQVIRDFVQTLQSLGYLPTAAQELKADLTHRLDGTATLETIQAELARVEDVQRQLLPGDAEAGTMTESVKQTILRLSAASVPSLPDASQHKEPPHDDVPRP